jgi:hypothetical protein
LANRPPTSYVFKRPEFIEYFNHATPVMELGRLNIGAGGGGVSAVLLPVGQLRGVACRRRVSGQEAEARARELVPEHAALHGTPPDT